jgi:hypothetical protein
MACSLHVLVMLLYEWRLWHFPRQQADMEAINLPSPDQICCTEMGRAIYIHGVCGRML